MFDYLTIYELYGIGASTAQRMRLCLSNKGA